MGELFLNILQHTVQLALKNAKQQLNPLNSSINALNISMTETNYIPAKT